MKLNKDLLDATMMLSFILLVLVGTSEFENPTLKSISISILVIIAVVSIGLRILEARKKPDKGHH